MNNPIIGKWALITGATSGFGKAIADLYAKNGCNIIITGRRAEKLEAAEHVLRDTIAALQAGTPDYDSMVPELADAVRAQSAAMTPALASLGELQTLEHIGEPAQGAHQFRATFASGQALTWSISINGENKIQGLLIQ